MPLLLPPLQSPREWGRSPPEPPGGGVSKPAQVGWDPGPLGIRGRPSALASIRGLTPATHPRRVGRSPVWGECAAGGRCPLRSAGTPRRVGLGRCGLTPCSAPRRVGRCPLSPRRSMPAAAHPRRVGRSPVCGVVPPEAVYRPLRSAGTQRVPPRCGPYSRLAMRGLSPHHPAAGGAVASLRGECRRGRCIARSGRLVPRGRCGPPAWLRYAG